ncbi:hypothetical protein [Micromonospora sp. CPCC 206061]|uniref:hypothetical protein n=1 Tax=Micromonospora sp. CPCC 206061 TaxID=3122410 RepID=UPI002FF2C280
MLGLYRAVVLTLFLMRRNESQAVAGEVFGCSQSIVRRLRPLLRAVAADFAGQIRRQAKHSAVLVDGFRVVAAVDRAGSAAIARDLGVCADYPHVALPATPATVKPF